MYQRSEISPNLVTPSGMLVFERETFVPGHEAGKENELKKAININIFGAATVHNIWRSYQVVQQNLLIKRYKAATLVARTINFP